jgi:hypothetical protein
VGSLRVLSSLSFCRPALQLNYRNQQLLISARNLLPSSSQLRHHLARNPLHPQLLPPTRLDTSPHHRTKRDLLQPLLLCHPRRALLGPMLPELPNGVQQQPPTAAGHVQPIAARPAAQGAAQPNPDALFHFPARGAIQARLREVDAEEANGAQIFIARGECPIVLHDAAFTVYCRGAHEPNTFIMIPSCALLTLSRPLQTFTVFQ